MELDDDDEAMHTTPVQTPKPGRLTLTMELTPRKAPHTPSTPRPVPEDDSDEEEEEEVGRARVDEREGLDLDLTPVREDEEPENACGVGVDGR